LSFVPGVNAALPDSERYIDLRGFATGMPAHVDALNPAPDLRLADAEVAWSGASVDADEDGLKGAKLNEVSKTFQPDKAGKLSYARGSGLELGLGTNPPLDENQLQLTGKAEADAPPSSSATESTDIDVDPVARASLLRGVAVANANDSGLVPDVCILGDDISRGEGYATDVELLDAGGDANADEFDAPVLALDDTDPNRAVSQSTSRMKLVPSGGNQFGLMAETRQTIAPISVLQDDDGNPVTPPAVITIEVLGEWVLRVVATGKSGGATVFYGPADMSPATQAVKITGLGDPIILLTQDLLGEEGLDLPLIPGVLELTIGEDPRAIAAPGANPNPASKPALASNGRSASAAADVVRVRVLDGQLVDLRVGHMEVSAEVPNGGVTCPIPVSKSADPDKLMINAEPDTTEISITVHNVYDCDLTNTRLTDRIRQVDDTSPDFKLLSADPEAVEPDMPTGVLTRADVVWSLGTIKKGETRTVTLELQSAGHGGVLEDIAEAAGEFANCSGQDATGLAIAGLDLTGLSVPVRVNIELAATGAQAKQTVAVGGGLALLASALGMFLRRRSVRKI
jgi:LPXTG-motif cell wall-anchored protein